MNKLSLEEVNMLIDAKGGVLLSEYRSVGSNLTIKCSKDHVFDSTLSRIKYHNSWCKYCFLDGRRNTIEQAKKLAKSRGGKCLSEQYKNVYSVLEWRCEKQHTWKARYNNISNGLWCPFCAKNRKKTIQDAQKLAEEKNGLCLSESYTNDRSHLTWQCDKGHIWETSYHCIRQGCWCPSLQCSGEKTKKTWRSLYGVDHNMRNRDILIKAIKNNCDKISYWKTGESIPWRGSWERKTIEHFNQNQIDFSWQIEFTMPDGRKYFCDFYIPNRNLYIEVKGRFIRDAEEKWDWFHKKYPNSELWDKNKLKELGIL